jgi:hypothetical protein
MKYFLKMLAILGLGMACLPTLSYGDAQPFYNYVYACPVTCNGGCSRQCTNASASKTLDDTKIRKLVEKYKALQASADFRKKYSFDLKGVDQWYPWHRMQANSFRYGVLKLTVGDPWNSHDFVLKTEDEAKQFCKELLGTVIHPSTAERTMENFSLYMKPAGSARSYVISVGYLTSDKITRPDYTRRHFCENPWGWGANPGE